MVKVNHGSLTFTLTIHCQPLTLVGQRTTLHIPMSCRCVMSKIAHPVMVLDFANPLSAMEAHTIETILSSQWIETPVSCETVRSDELASF